MWWSFVKCTGHKHWASSKAGCAIRKIEQWPLIANWKNRTLWGYCFPVLGTLLGSLNFEDSTSLFGSGPVHKIWHETIIYSGYNYAFSQLSAKVCIPHGFWMNFTKKKNWDNKWKIWGFTKNSWEKSYQMKKKSMPWSLWLETTQRFVEYNLLLAKVITDMLRVATGYEKIKTTVWWNGTFIGRWTCKLGY